MAPQPFENRGCGSALRLLTDKPARQIAYLAFWAALNLAQRALAAAAIFRRPARLMVRFLGAALAVPLTFAQRALAAAEIFRRAAALMVHFLGAAFPSVEELETTASSRDCNFSIFSFNAMTRFNVAVGRLSISFICWNIMEISGNMSSF